MIINGELQTGLGGGICQVSTTVFNAVYEAGLQIDERTNHALYISHYPLGRDATVNYPDLDLKFTNDTDHWLLLRTFVGAGSLTVNLYGTPQDRRVETTAQPLPRRRRAADQAGAGPDAREGHVRGRRVRPAGALDERQQEGLRRPTAAVLHEDTWYSSYRSETEGRPRRHEAEAEARAEAEGQAAEGRSDRSRRDGRRAGRAAGVYPASALATASTNQAGTRGRPPRRPRPPWRATWTPRRRAPRRARPRTRSGSAPRAGRRSASRPGAGRRSTPRGDSARRPRSSAPRSPAPGSPDSRRHAPRDRRRAPPPARRRRTRGARSPGRPSRRSGRRSRSRT